MRAILVCIKIKVWIKNGEPFKNNRYQFKKSGARIDIQPRFLKSNIL
jgi:hypothetical protein